MLKKNYKILILLTILLNKNINPTYYNNKINNLDTEKIDHGDQFLIKYFKDYEIEINKYENLLVVKYEATKDNYNNLYEFLKSQNALDLLKNIELKIYFKKIRNNTSEDMLTLKKKSAIIIPKKVADEIDEIKDQEYKNSKLNKCINMRNEINIILINKPELKEKYPLLKQINSYNGNFSIKQIEEIHQYLENTIYDLKNKDNIYESDSDKTIENTIIECYDSDDVLNIE